MKAKVIGYVRVSTNKQEASIEDQKISIEEFCRFKDFELVKIFEDPAISARKISFLERNTGKEIIEFLKDNKNIKYIILKAQDRLFRNVADALTTTLLLKEEYGVNLYIHNEGGMIDLENPDQWLLFAMRAVFAQFEAMMTGYRTKSGLKYTRNQKGTYLGTVPLGYKRIKDENNRTKSIVRDWKELRLISRAYKLKVKENLPAKKVRRLLGITQDKLRTRIQAYERIKGIKEQYYK